MTVIRPRPLVDIPRRSRRPYVEPEPGTNSSPRAPQLHSSEHAWARSYRARLRVTDTIIIFASIAAAFVARFGLDGVATQVAGFPVAYFTIGSPTRGLPEIEYEWDEQSYRFASAEDRELFKADPVRYAPQFGNFCAMALSKGEVVVADPENWLISDDKLYVFGKPAPAGPVLFQQNLPENIDKANRNRAILPKP